MSNINEWNHNTAIIGKIFWHCQLTSLGSWFHLSRICCKLIEGKTLDCSDVSNEMRSQEQINKL